MTRLALSIVSKMGRTQAAVCLCKPNAQAYTPEWVVLRALVGSRDFHKGCNALRLQLNRSCDRHRLRIQTDMSGCDLRSKTRQKLVLIEMLGGKVQL